MSAGEQMAEGGKQKAGGVPEGWREVKLGEVGRWRGGGTPSKSNPEFWRDGTIPWVSPKDMKSQFISDAEDYITENAVKNSLTNLVDSGSLLVVTRSGILRHSLPTAITTRSVAINQDIKSLTPSVDNDVVYLANVFWGFEKDLLEKCQKDGTTVESIDFDALKNYSFLLPPLPEQHKIAAILSTWDDALATLGQLLEAKRQQKRGLAEALLTGKTRLKGFSGEWESHPLGLLMPQKPKETAGETEYPILSVTVDGIKPQGDHFNKRVASEKTSDYLVVRRGEIAMSGLNFWMGAIDMQTIEDAGVISPAYKVFRTNPKQLNSDFARHFVRSEKMRQILLDSSIQGASIVRRNLDMQSLKESEVMVPPLPEQKAIASVLSTLDAEIASLEALRGKVQEQKRGLMDELLTGRVRVRVDEA